MLVWSLIGMKWLIRVVAWIVLIELAGISGLGQSRTDGISGNMIFSRLSEARSLLADERVALLEGIVGVRRVRVSRRRFKEIAVTGVTGREMALAVLDTEGRFHRVRGIKHDKRGFETLTPGYRLSLRKENGINSEFECVAPSGGRVLAIKYPVSNGHGRFGGNSEVIEAIYTPYSGEIAIADIAERGLDVQDGFIEKA